MIFNNKGYPVSHQTLKFGMVELQDENFLSSYEIGSGANIDVFLEQVYISVFGNFTKTEFKLNVRASDTIARGEWRYKSTRITLS